MNGWVIFNLGLTAFNLLVYALMGNPIQLFVAAFTVLVDAMCWKA